MKQQVVKGLKDISISSGSLMGTAEKRKTIILQLLTHYSVYID